MLDYKVSSTCLLSVSEQGKIIELSAGATQIGLQQGELWPAIEGQVYRAEGQDYLVQADPLPDGGQFIHLHPLVKQQQLNDALALIAQCNLRDLPRLSGKLGNTLQRAASTLNEAIKQSIDASKEAEQGAEELVDSAEKLSDRTTSVASQLEQSLSATKQLEETIGANLRTTEALREAMSYIDQQINTGKNSIEQAYAQMQEIASSVDQTQEIVRVIDEIAFKTNMLSLNAAVEAARAGEAGRGFSIVAKEVRDLAGHSAKQSDSIKAILKQTRDNTATGQEMMNSVSESLETLFDRIKGVNDQTEEINAASQDQSNAIRESTTTLDSISSINEQNALLAESLNNLAVTLKSQTGHMRDAMEVFQVQQGFSHPNHERAFELTSQAAEAIGKQFEQAITEGKITRQALFNREYNKVAGTNPVRFTTSFDKLCDQLLPNIQEPLLAEGAHLIYLIATDDHGYVPTHNNAFCQALTGDPKKDLAGNRTKRIFTDRVGQSAGSHTRKYLILTYRRDTGEVLNDISCPIYVNGEHWGGVRCGYRL